MAAYLTARLRVKNPEALAAYSKAAAPIIGKFGGTLLFKGGAEDVLLGDIELPNIAVFEFPDEGAVQEFFHSADYQALASLRDEGAQMVLAAHKAS